MEIYLISDNLYENSISFSDRKNIEAKKMSRPLSIEGENVAKNIALLDEFEHLTSIYASMYAGAIGAAKYLADRYNRNITIDENLNDCKVGELGTKSIKMVSFMQEHDFNIKLNGGESLTEVGKRIEKVINKIIYSGHSKVAVYSHRRAILGYLILNAKIGYNLDDNLIVEYNEKVIYNDVYKDADIVKLTIENKKITNIDVIDL